MRRPLASPAFWPESSIVGVPEQLGSASITTGSVIVGSGDVGLIVWVPEPGIANVIVSVPAMALARVIASRRLQWTVPQKPSPASSAALTVKEGSSVVPPATTARQAENSEVLPFGSVTVAVTKLPTGVLVGELV